MQRRISLRELDIETKGVKFNGARIVMSEFANRDEILNQGGSNENVAEMEGVDRSWLLGRSSVGYRHDRIVADSDERIEGRSRVGKYTSIVGYVGQSTGVHDPLTD